MKQLLILRHAQALSTPSGGTDKDRALSPQGKDDTRALGATMSHKDIKPDIVLCSPAVRTRQTVEGVMEAVPVAKTEYPEAFYNAAPETYINAAQGVSDGANSLLIVGHNPGIHMFAASMADPDSPLMDRLAMSYAPATLSILEFEADHWADIAAGQGKLLAVLETIDYNAPERPTRWM